MQKGTSKHKGEEDPIFDDISLYKIIETTKGRTVILHMDGAASIIIPFDPVNPTAFVDEDYEELFTQLQNILQDMDHKDTTVQFAMSREQASSNFSEIDTLPTFLRPRAEVLEILSKKNMLFNNKFYVTIHCSAENTAEKKGMVSIIKNLIAKYKNQEINREGQDKKFKGIEGRVTKAIELSNSVMQVFDNIGCEYKILRKPAEYYEIIQQFTRPAKSKIDKETKSGQSIEQEEENCSPRQAIFSGVRVKENVDHFYLDDYYHKVYTLDKPPVKPVDGSSISAIDSLPAEFLYTVTFKILSDDETMNKFKYKLAEARIMGGSNDGAIVEDRRLIANEQNISEQYDSYAFGVNLLGVEASVALTFKIHDRYIKEQMAAFDMDRADVLSNYDMKLSRTVFAAYGGSSWVAEEQSQWLTFCNILPGFANINPLIKRSILLSKDVPYLLAIYDGKMKGVEHKLVNHFIDTKENVVPFDLMNPELPAWNYSISGQTGSGKSVLMNALLTMQFADSLGGKAPVICILDVGGDRGSYTKILTLADGTSINLSSSTRPRIQMFELIPDRSIPAPHKKAELFEIFSKEYIEQKVEATEAEIKERIQNFYNEKNNLGSEKQTEKYLSAIFIETFQLEYSLELYENLVLKEGNCLPDTKKMGLVMTLMEIILSTNGKDLDGFVNYDPDEISELVYNVYKIMGEEEGKYPTVSDLYKHIDSNPEIDKTDPKVRKLMSKIKNWTVDGQYPMFDQPTSIDVSKDFVLADMKGLEAEPKLQAMYTMLISQIFNDKMYFIKDRRKLIVRDEAWSLMQNERARQYFVEDLRTARKNGFATVSITQLPTDYLHPNPQDGKAIMSSMQVNIFCKFNGASVCREVADEYGLNEKMYEELTTLGVVKELQPDGSRRASYSKFMMMVDKSVYILKNFLHPFEYQLYSSSAEDNAIIDYFINTPEFEGNLEGVLRHISMGDHKGDEGLIQYLKDAGHNNALKGVIIKKK